MSRALTAKAIENLAPGGARREVADPAMAGLYLVVQPTGVKSWALRYRFAGRPRKFTLGRWPAMGLKAARTAAGEALDAIEHGRDPGAEHLAAKRPVDGERDKVRVLIDQFHRRHLAQLKRGKEARRFLDRFVVAEWGERDIGTITRRDVLELLDRIVDEGRGTTANRVLAHARTFFNWARARDIIASVPTDGVKPPHKELARDRVLSDAELRLFWRACDDVGEPWGPLGKALLLTGQRLGEAVAMTEDEVAGDLWSLSSERTKNGRAHTVPLSTEARAAIFGRDLVASRAGYLFTTTGHSPLSGFNHGRNKIAAAMQRLAVKDAAAEGIAPCDVPEIPHWTFHDLRRTAATGMARLGLPVHVVEAVLNHVSGTISGVAGVYNRHHYDDEKRAALAAWGRHVVALAGDRKASNVVPIGRAW